MIWRHGNCGLAIPIHNFKLTLYVWITAINKKWWFNSVGYGLYLQIYNHNYFFFLKSFLILHYQVYNTFHITQHLQAGFDRWVIRFIGIMFYDNCCLYTWTSCRLFCTYQLLKVLPRSLFAMSVFYWNPWLPSSELHGEVRDKFQ